MSNWHTERRLRLRLYETKALPVTLPIDFLSNKWPRVSMYWLSRFLLLIGLAGFASACSNLAGSAPEAAMSPQTASDPAEELANEMVGEANAFRSGFVGKGDDRIHYVETGSGPPIIMVHGFPSFWFVWFDQMAALRKCYRVIAIDAPGANLSAKPTDPAYYELENLADRLDAVIAELAPSEKVTLVGHDWGGRTRLELC